MSKQQTLKGSFSLSGKGLHTGLQINISFHPAPAGTGRVIRRVDIEGTPEIPALSEFVKGTERGTVLRKGDVQVSTIEHGLSALYALGVDNCYIDVDAPEFPILDGSAIEYVRKIKEVGLVSQELEREYYIVKQRTEVVSEDGRSRILLLPDHSFGVDVHISFDSPILSNQFASLDNLKKFETEIAASRTFVFVREIEALLNMGLIKGGDLSNALVIYERMMSQERLDKLTETLGVRRLDASHLGYLQERPVKWDNEPARHKLLDIIGDMALIGRPIKGRIIAIRPGHDANNKFARMVRAKFKHLFS